MSKLTARYVNICLVFGLLLVWLYIAKRILDASNTNLNCAIYCGRYLCEPRWGKFDPSKVGTPTETVTVVESTRFHFIGVKRKELTHQGKLYVSTTMVSVDSTPARLISTCNADVKSESEYLKADLIIKPPSCKVNNTNPSLIVLVNSVPKRVHNRQLIRDTWGSHRWYFVTHIRVLFMLALHPRDEINMEVQEEASNTQDILQANYIDHYQLMSRKVLASLKWVSESCEQFSYVIKTDEDMYINIFNLTIHLLRLNPTLLQTNNSNLIDNENLMKRSKVIICSFADSWKPDRVGSSKYHVSREMYPNVTFPPFCRGSMYILSNDMPCLMYQNAFAAQHLWLEDVFMTGLIPLQIGDVTFVDINEHGTYKGAQNQNIVEEGIWFAHVTQYQDRKLLWYQLIERICPAIIALITNSTAAQKHGL